MRVIIICMLLTCCSKVFSQQAITGSLLEKIIFRFEDAKNYTFQHKIISVNPHTNGLPSDNDVDFIPGREMLVVAVFSKRPGKLFARMLVTKRFNKKTAYDEHLFQPVEYEKSLHIHYALLRVAFPLEANKLNCGVNLQVFDKAHPADKVWLMVFAR